MSFSNETQGKIDSFAREQSRHYLDFAEMTYMEKLRAKVGQTRQKAGKKLARFKSVSDGALDAQGDLTLYMSDYMSDLISGGMSEAEAFEKAKTELETSAPESFQDAYAERLARHIMNRDLKLDETVGLFYAATTFLGLIGGALTSYILSGGRTAFLGGGWVDVLVGTLVGLLIGVGLGLLAHAIIASRGRR